MVDRLCCVAVAVAVAAVGGAVVGLGCGLRGWRGRG